MTARRATTPPPSESDLCAPPNAPPVRSVLNIRAPGGHAGLTRQRGWVKTPREQFEDGLTVPEWYAYTGLE